MYKRDLVNRQSSSISLMCSGTSVSVTLVN